MWQSAVWWGNLVAGVFWEEPSCDVFLPQCVMSNSVAGVSGEEPSCYMWATPRCDEVSLFEECLEKSTLLMFGHPRDGGKTLW